MAKFSSYLGRAKPTHEETDTPKDFTGDEDANRKFAEMSIKNLEDKGLINKPHIVNIKLKEHFVAFSYQPPIDYPGGNCMNPLPYRMKNQEFKKDFAGLWYTFQKIIPKDLKDGLDKNRP